jgi:hypothetical protein
MLKEIDKLEPEKPCLLDWPLPRYYEAVDLELPWE